MKQMNRHISNGLDRLWNRSDLKSQRGSARRSTFCHLAVRFVNDGSRRFFWNLVGVCAMAAVVRIKRRLNQEPAEALLLASGSKRFKGDGQEKNVFKFCGTIENQEENIETIAKLVEKGQKLNHRGNVRRRSATSPRLSKTSEHFQEKRYKLLNQLRKLEEPSDFRVYDLVCEEEEVAAKVEEIVECNGVPLSVEKAPVGDEEEFVYDVYYADSGDIDDSYIDQLLSVQPYTYDHRYSDSEEPDDEEDSNDENNWRNDYPDTEEDEDQWSNEDADLAAGMSRMNFAESDLSSEDDDFVYAKDYGNFADSKDSPAYAAFKKRIARQLEEHDDHSSQEDSLDRQASDDEDFD